MLIRVISLLSHHIGMTGSQQKVIFVLKIKKNLNIVENFFFFSYQAFWYTDKIGEEGNVFGNQDVWNGLGVLFDSFDNDNMRNNPYIMAMVNDGTIKYQHSTDGMSQQLGGCLRDFRNKPYPVRAKIEYYRNTLTVSQKPTSCIYLSYSNPT